MLLNHYLFLFVTLFDEGIKKKLSKWAKGLGAQHSHLMQEGNGGGQPFGYWIANKLILSKIKEALGLDQCKGCFTAAAPISVDTLLYFASLDIPIYEVFGQSECTGPHTVSGPPCWKIGTCGRPMKGTESMLVPSTGELCYRGRHIFMGYMHMPDKTAETIDEDGFLHSGDVAAFDEDNDTDNQGPSGFMKITGRIKELIITAGGENIPPVLIENEVKGACVAVSNCMLIGDKRKFLSLLVSLKVTVDADAFPTDILAPDSLFIGKKIGSTATTYTEAKVDPLWKKCIDDAVKVANSKTTSNAQIIQKWTWLPTDFCERHGDLTPTLKLKRNVVTDKHASLIDTLYME
jgi:long-chain-fatty-acid--CoA ligase ACSBG